MNRLKNFWKKSQLALMFTAGVFVILLLSIFLIFVCLLVLSDIGLIADFEVHRIPLFYFALVSLIMGTSIALIFSRIPLKPIRKIAAAAEQIADGDYSVRLDLRGPEELCELSRKFNHMTEELGSVELLRSDFVNNFSHEIRTPIVSIRGFTKILRQENLTEEERNEYLDIIIQESERLADLSTNVLNLSKIEQQTILTDKKRFNVSEQIRLAIAVIDSKWPNKKINFQFDCGELFIIGNEELLRQVWINLLDNAVKFSPDGGIVKIDICTDNDFMKFSFANQGSPIPPKSAAHIFDKFYQADTSHTTKGNGLGLALAKRIVELHGGRISLKKSDQNWTQFEIRLIK